MKPNEDQTSQSSSTLVHILWIVVLALLAVYFFRSYADFGSSDLLNMSYTDFKNALNQGNISAVTIKGDAIKGNFKEPVKQTGRDGTFSYYRFDTTLPSIGDPDLLRQLEKKGVVITAKAGGQSWLNMVIISLLPWVLILALFVYAAKKFQDRSGGFGGTQVGFAKSKAKLYRRSSSDVTFKDVAGLTNVKKEFYEIVDFLKAPSKYRALGARLPKGILLVGPPGTGKTLMARATAGEANVPFYSISGSEFVEMFVGVGASRVRDMFENAKRDAPSILFIDELDSIGRVRGVGIGGGHEEREQTLNQILYEMDGFAPQESVIVLASTNRPDILDPALIRPGRFDRQINLDLPQRNARKEILQIHSANVPLSNNVDFDAVAKRTVGFSGADLKNLVNEAAILAARAGKDKVDAADFENGMDKIVMGLEREELINDEDKKVIAYHEAGHTLVASMLVGTDPLQKVTIIPRGRALGATEQLPEKERYNLNSRYLFNRIAIMMGGRVAEKLVFSDVSSGAADDLKQATQLAKRMVCQWGMSEKIGPVSLPRGEVHPYLGREMTETKDVSEHTAKLIDDEVRTILDTMEQKSEELIQTHRDKLDALANALLEHETLSKEEVDQIMQPGSEQKAEQTVEQKVDSVPRLVRA